MLDRKIQVDNWNGDIAYRHSSSDDTGPSRLIPESTAGNAGLKIEAAGKLVAPNKAQLNLFAERPQIIIKSQEGWQCPHCGSDSGRVGAGAGPHAGRFDCAGCGRFIKWLSKKALAKIEGGQA